MKDEKEKLATGVQYAQFGLAVSLQVIKTIGEISERGRNFTVKEIQQLIADPEKKSAVEEIAEKIVREVLKIDVDPWIREKQKITHFYQECFGIKVDWSKIIIPENEHNFKCLELILQQITEDKIFEVYAKRFGKDMVYKAYESISKSIDRTKGGEPLRPKTDYALLHHGGQEPDAKHLNKSYDDFYEDGNKYMIVKEGMTAAMRYRFETGKMYDVKGLTRFHTLDSGGNAMYMCRSGDGRFYIDWDYRVLRSPVRGSRQVSF